MALKTYEEEEFRRRWRDDLPPEVVERCLEEARAAGNIFRAYACAVEHYLAQQQRPQRKKHLLEPPKERWISRPKISVKIGKGDVKERRERPAKEGIPLLHLPWQAYAALASLLLAVIHPLMVLLTLPIVALLYVVRRNTIPMWTEDNVLVWEGRRHRFYEVERVFRDVNGMGSLEFSNTLITTTHAYNGIYYRSGKAWILLEDGVDAEEARRVLRRFGVVVKP
jgi:hypothetical protein